MGAASIKLEINRSRKQSQICAGETSSNFIVPFDDLNTVGVGAKSLDKLNQTSESDYEEASEAEGGEIAEAILESIAMDEGPLDVLTWLDDSAPAAYFDRFVTLKELFEDWVFV